jgi:hypothetical protein
VVEIVTDNTVREYPGVLKEYTAEFLELMDVKYDVGDGTPKKADIIIPRRCAAVRHMGE